LELTGDRFPCTVHTNLIAMKYKVIKEYAGIEVYSEVKLSESSARYMIEQGYVEPITEHQSAPVTVTIEGRKLAQVLNKAIEPNYKRNKIK